MRIALWIIAALAAISLAALALLYALFDGETIKPRLQEEVRARTQRELSIAGPVGLAVFPRIALTLPATTLSERGSAQPFAQLASARVAVALLPLLRGHVAVDTVTIDGLQATLVRGKDGRLNIDDLLGAKPDAKPAPAATAQPAATSQPPADFELGGIALSRATLTLRDLRDGRELKLSELDLKAGRIAPRSSPDVEISARFASGANSGELKAAGQLELDLPAARYGVTKLVASSTGNWDKQAFEFKLASPQFVIAPDQTRSSGAEASLKLAGTSPLELSLKLGAVSGPRNALATDQLELRLREGSAVREVSLQATGPARTDLDALVFDLPALKGSLALKNPALPQAVNAPLEASLRLAVREESARLKLATRLDDAPANLDASLKGFATPVIDFRLEAARLDLDHWLPPAAAPAPAKAASISPIASAHAAAAAPGDFDLAFLKPLRLNGQIAVQALRARGVKAAQVRATLKAAGGRLTAAPLSAQLYGGSLAGSAWAQADQRLGAALQLSGVDLAPLLRDLGAKGQLEGRANLKLDLATQGRNTAALLRALAGQGSARIEHGAIRGFNLERILSAARGRSGTQTERSNESDKTEFSELSASFVIAQGVLRNQDLKAVAPLLRATGAGEIDLAAASLDYTLRATLTSSAQRAGLTVPVKLSGPLAQMHITIDWGALAAEALRSEIERRIAPGGSGSENPVDALRKLFRR